MDYFARYGLGKKQTDRKEFKEYDQSFFLIKKQPIKIQNGYLQWDLFQ